MAENEQLATYLNDHLAGSMAGRDLAEKVAADNEGTALGSFASTLLAAIEEDKATLESLMQRLDVEQAVIKQAAGRLAEKVSLLRLHKMITGKSELSRLMELETLMMGVLGKLALWQTLQELAATEAGLAGVDLDRLVARAREQLQGLEDHHRAAATDAF